MADVYSTNPVPPADQAKAIREISDDPRQQIAFALYFGIMATASPDRFKDIWAVAEKNNNTGQYLRQADVILALFPEFGRG